MADLLTLTDNRTKATTRVIDVGDTIILSNDLTSATMVVALTNTSPSTYGLMSLKSATVVSVAATLADLLKDFVVGPNLTIVPSANVDISLVGTTDSGDNISLS